MTIKIYGSTSTLIPEVEANTKALRTTVKPTNILANPLQGHYSLQATTGAMASIGTGNSIFTFRWAPGLGYFAAIRRVMIDAVVQVGFTAGQAIDFQMIIARQFVSSDSGGTTVQVPQHNDAKNYFLHDASRITDVRIAGTGSLTAGTRKLDNQAIATVFGGALTTTAGACISYQPLYACNPGEHPILLEHNEGFVITLPTALGSGGSVKSHIVVEWEEIQLW